MPLDLSLFTTEQKYDYLRTVINMAQKRFGNSGKPEFDFQDGDGKVNLLGVRGCTDGKTCESTNKKFDDTMFVVYKSGGAKKVDEFELSTEYGTEGTAVLVLGQHKYEIHYHKETAAKHLDMSTAAKWKSGHKYRALQPSSEGVTVLREKEGSRNLKQDAGEGEESGNQSINIHYGGESGSPMAWSEGCQVIRGWDNFKNFIRVVESDHSVKGSVNNELAIKPSADGARHVIYTLVEGAFLEKAPSLPLDIGEGASVATKAIEKYYTHTEKDNRGGYFPIGANTVWHGGVHVHAGAGTFVAACATGEIVAARLAEDSKAGEGHYGSRNFILLRHKVEKKEFYSLFMHLNREELKQDNKKLKQIPWIVKKVQKLEVLLEQINYRSEPKLKKSTLLGQLKRGDVVTAMQTPKSAAAGGWVAVRHEGDSKDVYIKRSSAWQKSITETVVDKDLLDKLKSGKIVKLALPVNAGEYLWTIGEYGSKAYRRGLVHWEIFSKDNLFPDWTEIKDTDSDFNMDSAGILKLVDQDEGWFESDENLTAEEVQRFYKENKKAEALRSYACRFVSEWAVDLDKSIEKMKGRWTTHELKQRLSPYLWWDEASKEGVPLPGQKHVWHYNPIRFVEALYNSELR
jgi:hypothetical protein